MSECSIITFNEGEVSDIVDFQNAWGGAAGIWTCLYDKYLKKGELDSWMMNSDELWRLGKDKRLSECERAVLIGTFDYATIKLENYPKFAKHLREFRETYQQEFVGKVCHLAEWAGYIEKCEDELIGFHATSVSENLFLEWNEEEEESVVINIDTHERVFEVYEHFMNCLEKE
jgi:hypothetical protein